MPLASLLQPLAWRSAPRTKARRRLTASWAGLGIGSAKQCAAICFAVLIGRRLRLTWQSSTEN
jgi:hypothetical protein